MSNNKKKNKSKKNNQNNPPVIKQNNVNKGAVTEKKNKDIKKSKKKIIINIIIFLAYATLLIITNHYHELWRDEAQGWLLAKNLNFVDILKQLKYEGHPFFWYYLLKIFAILKLKYEYIGIISVGLNLITVGIILRKSKLNALANAAIVFSSPVFIYCGVLTRSYSLAYLLVVLLAFVYKDRYEKPILYSILLFLIMNTHILLLGFVGSLILIDIYKLIKQKENKKPIAISLGAFIIGMVTLVLQFVNTIDSTGKTLHFDYLKYIFLFIKGIFSNCVITDFWFAIAIITLIVYIIYLLFNKEYENLIILGCGLLFQILFATMIYSSSNAGSLVFINMMFIFLQSESSNKFVNWITIIIFSSTLYCTYHFTKNEIKFLFSDSENIANYIEENVPKGSTFYCERVDFCAAINAHLEENTYHFIDYNTDKEYTYTEYGDYLKILNNETINSKSDFITSKDMPYYISTTKDRETFESKSGSNEYELIYATDEYIYYSNESYIMYKHK